ncbi:MAG: FAD-binding oxidoreductase, partial [Pseudomonadota bacterium]
LDAGSGIRAAFSPNDGAVDPVLATRTLLNAAERLGATVRFPVELVGVNLSAGRLTGVETSAGRITADRLVLATGAASHAPGQFAAIDIPQRSTPGVIVVTRPLPTLLHRIVAAPGVHMHQRQDGRMVLGEQAGAPNTEKHDLRLRAMPNDFPSEALADQHAARILAMAASFLPGASAADVESVYIGWRPLPLDGHPVLGASPARRDVYLAITHSGVSLAPIVGQLMATELIGGDPLDGLSEYRPGRAFERIKRY